MISRFMFSLFVILLTLSFSNCEKDSIPNVCGNREVIEQFEDKYLRFIITEARPKEAVASFFHLDSTSNITTEYQSCILHDYKLEHKKIVKASGKVFGRTEKDVLNYIQVENYSIVDYCTPSFEITSGEFTLENRWDILSLETPDTVLYVPCETYPSGAFLAINDGTISGSTGANGFGGPVDSISPTEFQLDNYNLGLLVGTKAENMFQNFLIECLAPKTNLNYTIENNTLLIQNPANNYSIKLFAL